MAADVVTKEEFAAWVRPQELLNMLPWDYETAASAIADQLSARRIVAVAEEAVLPTGRADYYEVPGTIWDGWACIADHKFWQTGQTTFWKFSSTGYNTIPGGMKAFNVRFNPHHVQRLLDANDIPKVISTRIGTPEQRGTIWSEKALSGLERALGVEFSTVPAQAPRARKTHKDVVTPSEADAWFKDLPPEDRLNGQDWLWDELKRHFAPRWAPRKLVEAFTKGRPKGRRKTNAPK